MTQLLRERRTEMLSLKVTAKVRAMVEQLVVTLTTKRKRRHTLTDVIEEALRRMARSEKVIS